MALVFMYGAARHDQSARHRADRRGKPCDPAFKNLTLHARRNDAKDRFTQVIVTELFASQSSSKSTHNRSLCQAAAGRVAAASCACAPRAASATPSRSAVHTPGSSGVCCASCREEGPRSGSAPARARQVT